MHIKVAMAYSRVCLHAAYTAHVEHNPKWIFALGKSSLSFHQNTPMINTKYKESVTWIVEPVMILQDQSCV